MIENTHNQTVIGKLGYNISIIHTATFINTEINNNSTMIIFGE